MNEINHLNFNDEELFIDNESDINQASRALKAMGHPLRLKILCILASHKEASVQDLVDLFAIIRVPFSLIILSINLVH